MTTEQPNSQRQAATGAQRAARALRQAERLAEQGQVDAAIQSIQRAMRFGADLYTCYLQMARLYQTSRRWEEAVRAAEQAIAEQPEQLSAREAVIALYLELRNYPRAIDASQELLKLAPRHLPARDALGAAYIGMGDIEAAMRVANDLIRLDPNDPTHRLKRALLFQHQGEVRLAVEEFERVMEMAHGTELAQSAREQLDVLDAFQLNHLLILAGEDPIFRLKLLRNPEAAANERGFYLSESGRMILTDIVAQGLVEIEIDARPHYYH